MAYRPDDQEMRQQLNTVADLVDEVDNPDVTAEQLVGVIDMCKEVEAIADLAARGPR